jgi:hypoxanthine phosphoribosyltransferase
MKDVVPGVFLPKEDIMRRVGELAAVINNDYAGRELLVVGILKGSFIFMADLIRLISVPSTLDFVRISSYGSNTASSGNIVISKDMETPVAGRDVLIVEDILDTGFTLSSFVNIVRQRNPASIKVCVLLDKPARRVVSFEADYVGFAIPDKFVVGYGLDCDEKYRYFPDVRVLGDNGEQSRLD